MGATTSGGSRAEAATFGGSAADAATSGGSAANAAASGVTGTDLWTEEATGADLWTGEASEVQCAAHTHKIATTITGSTELRGTVSVTASAVALGMPAAHTNIRRSLSTIAPPQKKK